MKNILITGLNSGLLGSKDWGTYSFSKSALNMLLKVYAKEVPQTYFTALAPSIISTKMLKHIIQEVDDILFPSAKTLKESYIQTPPEAEQNLLNIRVME